VATASRYHGAHCISWRSRANRRDENPFHPCRDYLRGLEWDGTKRVDSWLSTYISVQAALRGQHRHTVAHKCRGAHLAAGCQSRFGAGAEGPQGIGKSSTGRVLFEPWFTDHLPDLCSKDAFLQLAGMWCVELAELDAIGRADASRIKSFLSSSVDRYRLPYGKRAIDVPRASVFLGTVNHGSYLRDETGTGAFGPSNVAESTSRRSVSTRTNFGRIGGTLQERRAVVVDTADLAHLAADEQSAVTNPTHGIPTLLTGSAFAIPSASPKCWPNA